MDIAWGSLLVVLIVSLGASVLVVALVSFALVGLGARNVSPDGPSSPLSAGTGTAVAAVCLVAAAAVVLYGLYIIVA